MTLERHKSNFLEYDVHWVMLITTVLFSGYFTLFAFSQIKIRITYDKIDYIALYFVLIITAQSLFIPKISYQDLFAAWILLIAFCLLRKHLGLISQNDIANCFLYSSLIVFLYQLFGMKIFPTLIYNNISINSGENANYYSSCLSFLVSIAIGQFKSKNDLFDLKKITLLVSILLCFGLICNSQSRTAILSSLIGIAFLFCLKTRFNPITKLTNKSLLTLILFLIIGISLSALAISINSDSFRGRLLIYEISSNFLKEHFISGIGFQRFKDIYNNTQASHLSGNAIPVNVKILADDTFFCFNEFLQIFVELGVIGFFILLYFIAQLLKIYCARKNSHSNLDGAAASLLTIFFSCQVSYPLHTLSILINCIFFIGIITIPTNGGIVSSSGNSISKDLFILLIFQIFILFACKREFSRYKKLQEWELAAHLALTGDFRKANGIYLSIYPYFQDNGNFLFNYATELFIKEDYTRSIHIFENSSKLISHSSLYIYMGNNYFQLANYKRAEFCYRKAADMVPAKFFPKYLLFRNYIKMGNVSMAQILGKNILDWPIKIPSAQVSSIKDEVRGYMHIKPTMYTRLIDSTDIHDLNTTK